MIVTASRDPEAVNANRIICLAATILLSAAGCGGTSRAPADITHTPSGTSAIPAPPMIASFRSGGKDITLEAISPEQRGRAPVVILLHGAYGLDRDGGFLRDLGRSLADRGFLALIPHYFERTGTKAEDLVDARGVTSEGAKRMDAHLPEWEEIVGDAIDHAVGRVDADAERIGVLGFSLGAVVGSTRAAHDHRIKAVVDYVGGLPFENAEMARASPPTLIIQGDKDRLVPAKYSEEFDRLLRSEGVTSELVVYPGQDHYFGEAAARDAGRRAIEFLAARLKKPWATPIGPGA